MSQRPGATLGKVTVLPCGPWSCTVSDLADENIAQDRIADVKATRNKSAFHAQQISERVSLYQEHTFLQAIDM